MIQKRYVVIYSGCNTSDRYFFDQVHFETNQKSLRLTVQSYGWNSGFHVIGDLDLWPIFYLLSHKVGMKYWSRHAKFHKNLSSLNGWYGCGHTHTQTHTEGKINSLANIIATWWLGLWRPSGCTWSPCFLSLMGKDDPEGATLGRDSGVEHYACSLCPYNLRWNEPVNLYTRYAMNVVYSVQYYTISVILFRHYHILCNLWKLKIKYIILL